MGIFSHNRSSLFFDMKEKCQLVDLGAVGLRFTWHRLEQGSLPIYKRLDRSLADVNWRSLFPDAYVENLQHHHSNHSPILLR